MLKMHRDQPGHQQKCTGTRPAINILVCCRRSQGERAPSPDATSSESGNTSRARPLMKEKRENIEALVPPCLIKEKRENTEARARPCLMQERRENLMREPRENTNALARPCLMKANRGSIDALERPCLMTEKRENIEALADEREAQEH